MCPLLFFYDTITLTQKNIHLNQTVAQKLLKSI